MLRVVWVCVGVPAARCKVCTEEPPRVENGERARLCQCQGSGAGDRCARRGPMGRAGSDSERGGRPRARRALIKVGRAKKAGRFFCWSPGRSTGESRSGGDQERGEKGGRDVAVWPERDRGRWSGAPRALTPPRRDACAGGEAPPHGSPGVRWAGDEQELPAAVARAAANMGWTETDGTDRERTRGITPRALPVRPPEVAPGFVLARSQQAHATPCD